MTEMQLIAALINTAGVLALVELIKYLLPILNEKVPYLIPIIAAAIGPLVAYGQGYLGNWIGFSIDLSPIVGVFTGAAATTIHQVFKQVGKAE